MRSFNAAELESKRHLLPEVLSGFSPELAEDKDNHFLVFGDDAFLFEKTAEGVYSGHLLTTGGKSALEAGKKALDYIFESYAKVIIGLTPAENRAALVFVAKLGFKNYGNIDTTLGEMRLSILTKEDYT